MAREICYEFGCFRLYPAERVLECDGREVQLHGQWFDILVILLKRRGHKVTNEELIGTIWPGRKRKDRADNLYVDIAGLRKALKEASPDVSEFIKNFRGEGYSFTADVYEREVPTTIAIQPFTREGSPTAPDAAGQRMADTLATMLNKHLSIRVVPSVTAVQEYNEHPELSALAFGHRLGADHVFSGSIGSGELKVSHLHVRTAVTVGPRPIKTSDPERFETYRLILKWMESELQLTPTDREAQQSTKQYTTNEKANDYYKKGRIQRFKGTELSLRKSLNYFKRATTEDPRFARAYANFADTSIFMGMMGIITPQKSYDEAKDAIKARDLDPTMASAHAACAFIKLFFERKWEEAKEGFEEAIGINPNYPVARMGYAHYFTSQGRHKEAKREIDEALALNPYSFFISFVRGMVYFLAREYRESLKRFEWTHELNLRFNLKSDLSHYGLSIAHEYLALSRNAPDERDAEFKLADDEARLAVTVSGGHPLKLLHRAHVNIMWNKKNEAQTLLDKVLRMKREGHYVSPYHLATVYAAMGEDLLAINSLKEAKKVPDQYLFLTGVDPRLDCLRPDPQFRELLLSLGLKV